MATGSASPGRIEKELALRHLLRPGSGWVTLTISDASGIWSCIAGKAHAN